MELDTVSISVKFLTMAEVPTVGRGFKLVTGIVLALILSPATAFAQAEAQEPPPSATDHSPTSVRSTIEILTPVNGVDFGQYVQKTATEVKKRWFAAMPDTAFAGTKGKTSVVFQIQPDGQIEHVELEASSGTDSLDQAALEGIRDASPLDPLPNGFKGPYIRLRFVFSYNLKTSTPVAASSVACSAPATDAAGAPPFDRLELVAFVTSGDDPRYVAQAICQRGISFQPEQSFVSALGVDGVPAGLLGAIAATKPKTIEELSADRLHANGNLDAALAFDHKRQFQSADEAFVRALKLAPDSATLHLAYARILMLEREYPEAEAQARRSLELWPEDAEGHVALALALAVQKRDSEAVPEAREALRIFPGHKTALLGLGMSLARSGQYKEAIPVLRQALQYAPEMPVIYKHLGGSLVHAGNYEEAIEELTLFLKTNPNDAESHYLLAVALRGKGQKEDALVQFREAARLDPTNPFYSVNVEPSNSKEPEPADTNPAEPRPDDGFISGNVYTNTFFNFSYRFPKSWSVLDAERGRALVRLGGAILSNGDPIAQDAAEASARKAYQLLLVAKETTKDVSSRINSIQVQALSTQFGPDLKSGGDFLRLRVQSLQHQSEAVAFVEPPEQFTVGGRSFWKIRVDIKVNNVVAHALDAATIEKGYVLLFVFTTQDAATLEEIAGTIQSLRFTDSSSH